MAKEIEYVLCGIDLLENCDSIMEKAIDLANCTDASVHVLHVVKPLSDDVMNTLKVNIREPGALDKMIQQRIDERRVKLKRKIDVVCQDYPSLQKAMEEGRIDSTVLEGYPASGIVDFASQENVSMIVIGANKQNHIVTYAGKVTKGVIRRAHVPVVVIPSAS